MFSAQCTYRSVLRVLGLCVITTLMSGRIEAHVRSARIIRHIRYEVPPPVEPTEIREVLARADVDLQVEQRYDTSRISRATRGIMALYAARGIDVAVDVNVNFNAPHGIELFLKITPKKVGQNEFQRKSN